MPDFLVDYKDLPATEGSLPGTSWALFNSKGGGTDQLGTLNYLTPEVVAQAAAGIKTGERVSLDLPLDTPTYALFGRQDYKHEIIEVRTLRAVPSGLLMAGQYSEEVCDDVINMNTQCSSQWCNLSRIVTVPTHTQTGMAFDTSVTPVPSSSTKACSRCAHARAPNES
jgi:hypothetical protein